MGRRSADLTGVNLLDLAPVRLAEFEDGGRVVVLRPRDHRPGPAGLLDRITWYLSTRRIRLDAFGSFAWRRFDGRITVREIAQGMRDEYGDEAEGAEERLGKFIHQLRGERLVAFPGYDEIQDCR